MSKHLPTMSHIAFLIMAAKIYLDVFALKLALCIFSDSIRFDKDSSNVSTRKMQTLLHFVEVESTKDLTLDLRSAFATRGTQGIHETLPSFSEVGSCVYVFPIGLKRSVNIPRTMKVRSDLLSSLIKKLTNNVI